MTIAVYWDVKHQNKQTNKNFCILSFNFSIKKLKLIMENQEFYMKVPSPGRCTVHNSANILLIIPEYNKILAADQGRAVKIWAQM